MSLRPAALVAIAAAIGCASQGMPPGGPPDKEPPKLTKVTPESGAVRATPRAVEFQFDEVVSERPRSGQSLAQIVVISPNDGATDVTWGRSRIVVRPGKGWRQNTAYTVTLLPGLSDLRGNPANSAFRTVFSTGASIPKAVVRGVAFDWMAGRAAPLARVEASVPGDSTLKWAIAADSTGRFALSSLPDTSFLVRVWIDMNANGTRDRNEPWDTTTLAVRDSARRDFYAFPHDTLGARIGELSVIDSMTLRVRFDHGLNPTTPLDGATIRLIRARDSSEIAIASVTAAARFDSLARARATATADSAARADTSQSAIAARARADSARRKAADDSTARAQMDSVRARRDTVRREPAPKPSRETPPTEFVIVTRDVLPEEVPLRLYARDVRSLAGYRASSDRPVTRRKPAPRDTTAAGRGAVPPVRPPTRPPLNNP
jgi:hypothetical protein